MSNERLLISVCALWLCAVGGCGTDCSSPQLNDTGTYRSVFVYQFSGVEPKSAFPQKRGKSLQMTVYRDLQQVTFEYLRDGKSVFETWNCTGRRIFNASAKAKTAADAKSADSATNAADTGGGG